MKLGKLNSPLSPSKVTIINSKLNSLHTETTHNINNLYTVSASPHREMNIQLSSLHTETNLPISNHQSPHIGTVHTQEGVSKAPNLHTETISSTKKTISPTQEPYSTKVKYSPIVHIKTQPPTQGPYPIYVITNPPSLHIETTSHTRRHLNTGIVPYTGNINHNGQTPYKKARIRPRKLFKTSISRANLHTESSPNTEALPTTKISTEIHRETPITQLERDGHQDTIPHRKMDLHIETPHNNSIEITPSIKGIFKPWKHQVTSYKLNQGGCLI